MSEPAGKEQTPAPAGGTPPASGDASPAPVLGGDATPPAADPAAPVLGGDAPPPTDDKPKDDVPPAAPEEPKAPEKYEVKLPDGLVLSDKEMELALGMAKTLGMTQKQAQAYAEHAAKTLAEARKSSDDAFKKQQDEWREQIKSDPDLGGTKFAESITVANKAYSKYASKDVQAIFNANGLANHPAVVKMFHTIGKQLEEGSFRDGGAASTPKDTAEILYDKMGTKEP